MAKVTGPLHCTEARGTIGKSIIYQHSKHSWMARMFFKVKETRTWLQDEVRKWFKDTIDYFSDMAAEEKFLWQLVLLNREEYNASKVKQTSRAPRCHLAHWILKTKSFIWNLSPFPPELIQWLAKDEIEGYEQLKSDLETLTGLEFCDPVNPYFFPYLGTRTSPGHPEIELPVAGLTNVRGAGIAIDEDYYWLITPWLRKQLIAHELTHALMLQHGWKYNRAIYDSEMMATECGNRVANGELEPIYKYKNKTLSEWVPDPEC